MKSAEKILVLLAFCLLTSAAVASAAPAPSPLSGDEAKYLEFKEAAMAPGSVDAAPVPLDLADISTLESMQAASGIDADSITAGTSVVDLILVILLVYLILRILD